MKWLISVILASTTLPHVFSQKDDTQPIGLAQIAQQSTQLRQIVRVDRERQDGLSKIQLIIRSHNTRISEEMKSKIAAEIYRMSLKYPNLDIDLICATITHESGRTWNPKSTSPAGALGLMQIMPATGQWLAKYEGINWTKAKDILYDPIYNIRMGSRYLSALIETYDLEGGLAAYNGGSKRVELWLAQNKAAGILWPETRTYVPHVLKIYKQYKSSTM